MSKRGRPVGSIAHSYPSRIGGKVTKIYGAWRAMLGRCYRKSSHNYAHYGERGITVCDRWRGKDGFDNFVADMGIPEPYLTLGRIDNDRGYSPDNCRWQTWKDQANNRRPKPQIPGSLRQLSRAAGLAYHVVYQRVKLHGWPVDKALATPVSHRRRQ